MITEEMLESAASTYSYELNGTSGNFTDDVTYAFKAGANFMRPEIQRLQEENEQLKIYVQKCDDTNCFNLKKANEVLVEAIQKSISIADDYADSGISQPIRKALESYKDK